MNWNGNVSGKQGNKEAAAVSGKKKISIRIRVVAVEMREADKFDTGLKSVKVGRTTQTKQAPGVLLDKGLERKDYGISGEGNRKRTKKGRATKLPKSE